MRIRNLLYFLIIGSIAAIVLHNYHTPPARIIAPKALPRETKIILTNHGFSPQQITINQGTALRWINNTNTDHASINSDPYPTNQRYPELNLGQFNKNATLVHIFTTTGKYTYHDQFHPKFTGTIQVK
jgi:plastocyanin